MAVGTRALAAVFLVDPIYRHCRWPGGVSRVGPRHGRLSADFHARPGVGLQHPAYRSTRTHPREHDQAAGFFFLLSVNRTTTFLWT